MKLKFYKDNTKKDGIQSQCIACAKQHDDEIEENEVCLIEEKKELNFKVICILKSRIIRVFKSQNTREPNKTFGFLGCSHPFLKKWIINQLYCKMNLENYGSAREVDFYIPISSFRKLDENGMKKCFS